MPKKFLPATIDELENAVTFVQTTLEKYHILGKDKMRALLLTEEAMVKLITNAPENGQMQVSIRRRYNTATITISAKGAPFEGDDFIAPVSETGSGHGSEEAIRSMLLRANEGRISYSRRGEFNFVTIGAGAKERLFAMRTFIAFFAAIVVAFLLGLILKDGTKDLIMKQFLIPIEDIFLKSLQLVTAPAVFFSLTTVVARMTSFSDPGRITLKILLGYVVTSILSVIVGIVVFRGYDAVVGLGSFLSDGSAQVSGTGEGQSIADTLIRFIPGNIIEPFLNTDSVQLLIIALLAGFALGKVGTYSTFLTNLAGALDKFFSSVVEIVSDFVPTATFFVTLLSLFYFGWTSLWASIEILIMTIAGFMLGLFLELLYVWIGGGLSPIVFVKKTWKTMWTTFLGGSSLGAVADTCRLCEKKLGVSSELTSFSIPFGATSNLNGNCIYLTIAGLSLAQLCGADILGKNLLTIAFMVLVLSVGSPITPGSAMLALTMLMSQMGVSLVAISLMLGLNALIEMLLASFNTMDDIATTLVVGKREHLFNEDIYYDRVAARKTR